MAENVGITEFKEVVVSACRIVKPLLDGLQLTDVFEIGKAFTTVPAAYEGIDQVPTEASDFSPEEMSEIEATVKEELGDKLNDEQLNVIVPAVVYSAMANARLAFAVKIVRSM